MLSLSSLKINNCALSDERYELNGRRVIRDPKSESLVEVLFPNSSKFRFALST